MKHLKKFWSFGVLLFLVTSASAEIWFKGTFDQALAKAKADGKMVLIDFFAGG